MKHNYSCNREITMGPQGWHGWEEFYLKASGTSLDVAFIKFEITASYL